MNTTTATTERMPASYYDEPSDHLYQARHMAARGDLQGAIRHAFWHGFHVGERDGHKGATSTDEGAYEALEFLLRVVSTAVGAGNMTAPHRDDAPPITRTKTARKRPRKIASDRK